MSSSLMEIYNNTLKDITRNEDNWRSFLSFCGNLYDRRFDEQVLIYAQNKKAVSVKTMEQWNRTQSRRIHKGSKAIAVFSDKEKSGVRYLFDVRNTYSTKNLSFPIWSTENYEDAAIETLRVNFDFETEIHGLFEAVRKATENAAEDHIRDYYEDLKACRDGSLLEELDEFNLHAVFKRVLKNSIEYMVLSRCGYEAGEYFEEGDFKDIKTFDTGEIRNILGTAVSDIASIELEAIESAVRYAKMETEMNRTFESPDSEIYNITIKKERNVVYENRIQGSGKLSVSGRDSAGAEGNSWEVRINEKKLPAKPPERDLHESSDLREAEQPFVGDTGGSHEYDGEPDSKYDEIAGRDRAVESTESDGVGRQSEQHTSGGGGNSSERTDIRVTDKSGSEKLSDFHFSSVNQDDGAQLSIFDYLETQEQSENTPVFHKEEIPDSVIDTILRSGGNENKSCIRIAAKYVFGYTDENISEFLAEHYKEGGKGFNIDGKQYAVWFNKTGLCIAKGNSVRSALQKIALTWSEVTVKIHNLLKNGEYLTKEQMDQVIPLEQKNLAESLLFLRQEKRSYFPVDKALFEGGFPESSQRIADRIADPDGLREIIGQLELFVKAYEKDRSLLRFHFYDPKKILIGFKALTNKPLEYPAKEKIDDNVVLYITEDEIDYLFMRGSGVSEGKMRIFSFFSNNHTPKEKVDFLKNEYGTGGYGFTGYNEWHDAKGILFKRSNAGISEPYDERNINWPQAVKRIVKLIVDKVYLNEKELTYIPEYEKKVLAAEIYLFFCRQPEESFHPYPYGSEYYDAVKAIYPQLKDKSRVSLIMENMKAVFDKMEVNDSPEYKRKEMAVRSVEAYLNGTFNLFGNNRKQLSIPLTVPEENTVSALISENEKTLNQKPEKTTAQGNFRSFKSIASEIINGECRYIRFEAGESFMPLTIQLIDENRIAVSHSYKQNGDLMCDPEMEFVIDKENESLSARTYRQDGLNLYQTNENSDYEVINHSLEKELNLFAGQWFRNIRDQGYSKKEMKIEYPKFEMTVHYADNNKVVSFTGWDNTSSVPLNLWKQAVKEQAQRNNAKYDLMFSHMGNGVSVCNKLKEKYGDYENVAHISAERKVTVYDKSMPEEIRQYIEDFAKHDDMNISASQPQSVFSLPPEKQLPTKKQNIPQVTAPFDYHHHKTEPDKQEPSFLPSKKKTENFRITNLNPSYGSQKERFQNNIKAIQILKECEKQNRPAGPKEQEILAKYVGWGGISGAFDSANENWKSEYMQLKELLTAEEYESAMETVLTSFYTPPVVITAMYKVLENAGFTKGNILDPGCGIGNFQGLLPESMKNCVMYGVEQDYISGKIAKLLYPENHLEIKPFEKTEFSDSFFDAAVGNIPFGAYQIADKRYDKFSFYVHDYFLAKTIDKLRPGGIMALITTKGTLDKKNPKVRKYLAQRAELIGAVRLPNHTFAGNAGTKVTSDILFFQKRERMIDIEPDWIYLDKDRNDIEINSYFTANPQMILGKMEMISSQFGMESACVPDENKNLETLLFEAVSKIKAEITVYEEEKQDNYEAIPADPSVRNFSFAVDGDKIYYRENSLMKRIYPSKTAESRIRGMIDIRNCTRRIIEYQTENYPDEEIRKEQKRLNQLYDSYVSKYGRLNARANSLAFREDSSYPLLCSLEIYDDEKKFLKKADMFTKRTIRPDKPVIAVSNPDEALAVSINEKGYVDIEFMAHLANTDKKRIIEELKGKIYQNPEKAADAFTGWEMAEEYLSGNIRLKLISAKQATEKDSNYEENVKALEAVLPKELGAGDIKVQLGTTWLPPDIVTQFAHELLNPNSNLADKITVQFMRKTGEWYISNKNIDKNNINAITKYGTKRINAYWIIEASLNLRTVRVYDTVYDPEKGKDVRVLNTRETAVAQAKQEMIQGKFENWIWKNPIRRESLCSMYNERFNSIRPRVYDGSHLVFPGMNPEIKLNPHQNNGVARIIYGGNTLLAHAVGGGKTYTLIAAAMEKKRLGLCNKPMFTVLNNTLYDFSSAFLTLYPNANILVATERDFEKKNRKKFFARISTGEFDAVILTHTQFGKIPISYERQERLIRQEIKNISEGIETLKMQKGESFNIKQLEKTKKSLQTRLERLNDQSKKDDIVTFEELGIDCLFVDEADMFKNLYLFTKMSNVAGISQTDSYKASDLFMKTRYLDEITGSKGVILATGTPISNAIVETYTMMRYTLYSLLEKAELEYFDAWASVFCVKTAKMELKPEGSGFQMKTRLSSYRNLPELMNMFRCAADIQTANMLDLPVPKVIEKKIVTPPTEIQIEMLQKIAERAEKIRKGNVDSSIDNMLLITNDGRKLALDQRVINPNLPDDPESKVNACVKNVLDIWEQTKEKKLTQLVFCDLSTPKGKYDPMEMALKDGSYVIDENTQWNVYQDIADKLYRAGVPQEEIAFIHEAKNDKQKEEIFAKVRTGKIRILFGSTMKMGAGTNVQKHLVALHDLDIPMRPRDLEQRHGRMVRFGNENDTVYMYRYITERTFDAYMYQMLENKQKIISQVMTSKTPARVIEDNDTEVLSYAECKAIATGDPRIMEYCTLTTEISQLEILKGEYINQKFQLEDQIIKYFPQEIKRLEQEVLLYGKDLRHLREHGQEPLNLKSRLYADKNDSGKALLSVMKDIRSSNPVFVGSYRGFLLYICYDQFTNAYQAQLMNKQTYTVQLGDDARGNITRIDNMLDKIPEFLDRCRRKLEDTKKQLENAKAEAKQPFDREIELKEKIQKMRKLKIDLKIDDTECQDTEEKNKGKDRDSR